jgi:riboflavin kinase/FMN adenylyltransferase
VVDGERVSSTRIRTALREGHVARAARFLGSPYALTGTVVTGDGRGRTIGFPTANIEVHAARKVIPHDGVYVVEAETAGATHRGMMNIGVRPTVTDGKARTLEVHLLGMDADLAGEEITVRFLDRLRDERKFGSLDELVQQLARDRAAAERFVDEH